MATTSIPLSSLQSMEHFETACMLAFNDAFTPDVVDAVRTELPYLSEALAIAARHAEKNPIEYAAWLRRTVDGDLRTIPPRKRKARVNPDEVAIIVRLIDPTHEDENRRSLCELLHMMYEQKSHDEQDRPHAAPGRA